MTVSDEPAAEASRQVIARAVAVLQTLEGRPNGLNMSQIARTAGLPRTTVQRLVSALISQNFLSVSPSGNMRLGPALARLAANVHVDMTAIVHPHLDRLRHRVGETVHLWVAAGNDVVLVDQAVCEREVCVIAPIGVRYPLACTAGGKAILATLPECEVRNLTDGRLTAQTKKSVLSIETLLADLEGVRGDGVAYDLEEHAVDVCAVGVALGCGTGDRFALCIAAPARRFFEHRTSLRQALLECRDCINDDVGG